MFLELYYGDGIIPELFTEEEAHLYAAIERHGTTSPTSEPRIAFRTSWRPDSIRWHRSCRVSTSRPSGWRPRNGIAGSWSRN